MLVSTSVFASASRSMHSPPARLPLASLWLLLSLLSMQLASGATWVSPLELLRVPAAQTIRSIAAQMLQPLQQQHSALPPPGNPFSFFEEVLVVATAEREPRVWQQAEALGLSSRLRVVSAVPINATVNDIINDSNSNGLSVHLDGLTPGESAILLSHRKALKSFLQNPAVRPMLCQRGQQELLHCSTMHVVGRGRVELPYAVLSADGPSCAMPSETAYRAGLRGRLRSRGA